MLLDLCIAAEITAVFGHRKRVSMVEIVLTSREEVVWFSSDRRLA